MPDRRLVKGIAWVVAVGLGCWLVAMWFSASNDHKRGAVLGVGGALLLSVDAFHNLYHKHFYSGLHEHEPTRLPDNLVGGVRTNRNIELARFSWLVFFATIFGAALLAAGFFVEFRSE